MRRAHIPILALVITTLPALAHATPSFPGEITGHLSLGYTPDCTLCHVGSPGNGTATSPFAISMKSRGLQPNNIPSVDTALDALGAENKDSDGDGVSDINELKAHTDPNVAGGAAVVPPTYGCGGGDLVAPMRPSALAGIVSLVGAIGLAFALRRRN